jgi:hypothetical protein
VDICAEGRIVTVRYFTHTFGHVETLERARRCLVEAGIDPSRIEVHTHGTPRIAVAVEPGEWAEVERVIDAVEAGDPDGNPSFWELACRQHVYRDAPAPRRAIGEMPHSESFVISWRPIDSGREVSQITTALHISEAYLERGD